MRSAAHRPKRRLRRAATLKRNSSSCLKRASNSFSRSSKVAMMSPSQTRRPRASYICLYIGNTAAVRCKHVHSGDFGPDRPEVTAGLDLLAGGSWIGLNDWGVAAAILNRRGSLGPAPGFRSRGELVLEALDHSDAATAAAALSALDPAAYRSFNLIIADSSDGFWLRHGGGPQIAVHRLKEGLSAIAAGELDDPAARRLELALSRFRAAAVPDPDRGEWTGWEAILACDEAPPGEAPEAAP